MENTGKEMTRLIELDDSSEFQIGGADASIAERRLILAGRQTTQLALGADALSAQAFTLSRLMDIVLAVGMLIVLLPVMLAVAITVKLSSSGPIIFPHSRIGRNGERFKCYKFRSMYDGAEQILARLLRENAELAVEWQTLHKLENDPRVTPVGRFLRATSLDELPQLFNVLKGEMALVGPRPIVTAELERYGRYRASYLAVRPGITGLWQVTGRSGTTYRRRIATDHLYSRKKCLALDIRIILATIPAVIIQRGAC